MLIHIAPRLFSMAPNVSVADEVRIVDLVFTADGYRLSLIGGSDLATRRPYTNGRYAVACRAVGRKAIDGILIETDEPLRRFRVTNRWRVGAAFETTHTIDYVVLDDELDAVSDEMCTWYAHSEGLGGWGSRWPDHMKDLTPSEGNPKLDLKPHGTETAERRVIDPATRWTKEKHQVFEMPTLERERFLTCGPFRDRIPSIETAFRVTHKQDAA